MRNACLPTVCGGGGSSGEKSLNRSPVMTTRCHKLEGVGPMSGVSRGRGRSHVLMHHGWWSHGTPPPSPLGQNDWRSEACGNITFPQRKFAGGNDNFISWLLFLSFQSLVSNILWNSDYLCFRKPVSVRRALVVLDLQRSLQQHRPAHPGRRRVSVNYIWKPLTVKLYCFCDQRRKAWLINETRWKAETPYIILSNL